MSLSGHWGMGACLAAAAIVVAAGCERKERVLEIKAPGVNIEVDRDKDSGAIDVDVDARNKR